MTSYPDASTGQHYSAFYRENILPFYEQGEAHQLTSSTGLSLAMRFFCHPPHQGPRKGVLIVTGYRECILKYAEIIYDLYRQGHDVFCYDHYGQGLSERFPGLGQKGHADSFLHFVQDLGLVFQEVRKHCAGDLWILAHSMGGAISTLAVGHKVVEPQGLILSAPMMAIQLLPWVPLEIPLWAIVQLMRLLGASQSYAFGQKDCNLQEPFEGNDLTSCLERYQWWNDELAQAPELCQGGPTFGWVGEAFRASRQARQVLLPTFIPTLLLLAGQDTVVDNKASNLFAKMNPHIKKIVYSSSRHEILREVDAVRKPALDAIHQFLQGDGIPLSKGTNISAASF